MESWCVFPRLVVSISHPAPPGYDLEGANDLKHKLVGTRKWIGTAELHVAFLTRGIPSRLVEFPDVTPDATTVLKWIETYFSSEEHEGHLFRGQIRKTVGEALRGASPVVVTDRMPIVLQHQGHSRTIVGYERRKDGTVNLLCFDPSRKPSKQVRDAALARFCASSNQSPTSPSSSHHYNMSPSKLFGRLLHPHGHDENTPKAEGKKKRRASYSVGSDDRLKRVRGGLLNGNKDETIEILDSDDEVQAVETSETPRGSRPAKELNDSELMKMLDAYRLKPKRVGCVWLRIVLHL